jgi:hypothetical protein
MFLYISDCNRINAVPPRIILAVSIVYAVAGELGFEPRQTESESVVLPLHHSPRYLNNIRDLTGILAVVATKEATPGKAVAPFYPLGSSLGKRAAVLML